MSDLQKAFNKRIQGMVARYNGGRVVFERYVEESLKNKTQQKRATTSVQYEIHAEMKLTVSTKEFKDLHHQPSKG